MKKIHDEHVENFKIKTGCCCLFYYIMLLSVGTACGFQAWPPCWVG